MAFDPTRLDAGFDPRKTDLAQIKADLVRWRDRYATTEDMLEDMLDARDWITDAIDNLDEAATALDRAAKAGVR